MSNLSPNELRQQLRAQRLHLSTVQRQTAALAIRDYMAHSDVFIAAARIAAYWACNGELDPLPVLESAWALGKAVYLPIVVGQSLQFAPYQPDTRLRLNRFRIPEPDVPTSTWLPATALDLVLAPLVAFDSNGTRLGMGGGFYDRSLAFRLAGDDSGQLPYCVGLAYELQRVAQLERQPWDVPLDAVVTESGWQVYGSGSQTAHR